MPRFFHQIDRIVEQRCQVNQKRCIRTSFLFFSSSAGPVIPPKPQAIRGVDLDAQGMINGQPTYEHDLMNAYKDDNEKPWKKPGLIELD